MNIEYGVDRIEITWSDDTPLDRMEIEQAMVLLEALKVYSERNVKYRDNWRRMGWRGLLIRMRERADRLWDTFWAGVAWKETGPMDEPEDAMIDADDAIDLINFAAFFIRQTRDTDREGWMKARDGEWWAGL